MRKMSLALFVALSSNLNAQNMELPLLSNWRFQKGTQGGAEKIEYNNAEWERTSMLVSIPHDWAICGPFDKEVDKQVVAIEQNGEKVASEKTGRSGSLPWIGEGWYRTSIHIPEGYSHAELQFDGAMSEPRVYIDGQEVGFWAFGYNTFWLDITNFLPRNRSTEGGLLPGYHTLAVHLQNVEESSRWYPGAGLYRPVRLLLSQDTGIKTHGVFARTTRLDGIHTQPSISGTLGADAVMADRALMTINTEIRKGAAAKREYKVRHTLLDENGKKVAGTEKKANSSSSYETSQVMEVPNASLWSPEHPTLYTLVTELLDGEKVIHKDETKTGIRMTEYSQEGFKLNGQLRKFKGVCLHHDMGPLGAAFNKAAFRHQVALLKEIGCDAIRTSHNMPAPWQMDICDEMGMLVMAESCDMWVYPKCKNGYSRFFEQVDKESPNADGRAWWERDFENLVLVHRNHPSIVMWSIGNEIPDQGSHIGLSYTRKIQDLIHRLDPTRPCTQGLDRGDAAIHSGVMQETDIPGFNYRLHIYEKGVKNSPKGILLGSETASTISSRGVYKFPVVQDFNTAFDDGQVSSYDFTACSWSNLPDDDWMWQDKAPWVIGEFVWTGFDYLGEPTPYDGYWPSRSSYFGIYDLAGLPKDRAYLYRVHWAPEKETLHLLPHWNWEGREGEVTPVFCYTNYPEAELFINGKSQGRRKHTDFSLEQYKKQTRSEARFDRYRMRWMDTRYEPGEVKVVAYDEHGNVAAEKIMRTAGKPHHIELSADRSTINKMPVSEQYGALDTPDLSFITVRVVDKDGNLCPNADNSLSFKVEGASAQFNSCCNGDATSLEVFTMPTMKVFHGELMLVVEATSQSGTSKVKVTGKGLKPATMTLEVK